MLSSQLMFKKMISASALEERLLLVSSMYTLHVALIGKDEGLKHWVVWNVLKKMYTPGF